MCLHPQYFEEIFMSPTDRGRGESMRVLHFLEQAERARRLCTIIMDEDLCEILELLAREYEVRARSASTEASDEHQSP